MAVGMEDTFIITDHLTVETCEEDTTYLYQIIFPPV